MFSCFRISSKGINICMKFDELYKEIVESTSKAPKGDSYDSQNNWKPSGVDSHSDGSGGRYRRTRPNKPGRSKATHGGRGVEDAEQRNSDAAFENVMSAAVDAAAGNPDLDYESVKGMIESEIGRECTEDECKDLKFELYNMYGMDGDQERAQSILDAEDGESIRKGSMILVNAQHFAVEEVDGDTVFATDKDGGDHEFNIKDIEHVDQEDAEGLPFVVSDRLEGLYNTDYMKTFIDSFHALVKDIHEEEDFEVSDIIKFLASKMGEFPPEGDESEETFNQLYDRYVTTNEEDAERVDKDRMKCNSPRRTSGGSKKFVVKACKDGKEKVVRFGDPNMRIKKSNPKRRKSFRARHKCDQKKDKFSAGYWSCKKW